MHVGLVIMTHHFEDVTTTTNFLMRRPITTLTLDTAIIYFSTRTASFFSLLSTRVATIVDDLQHFVGGVGIIFLFVHCSSFFGEEWYDKS